MLPSAVQAAPAAQPADTEQPPPVQQEPPLDPPFVVDPAPATVDTNVVAPVEDPVIKRENLPVIVTLETEESILTPDRTIAVTVTVRAEADLPTDKADLTLTLPKSIATTTGDKNKISWPLPALRANEETVQKLTLQIEKVGNALKREVGALVATVAAPSYPPVETATLLAFAPTPPATEDTQDASGAVIASSDGDVVLLAQSAVAPAGVVFRYSELYNWETVTSTVVTPASTAIATITPDIALTGTLSLTALTTFTPTDTLSTDQLTREQTPTVSNTQPTAKIDHNLDAYRVWQLDALQDGQNMHQLTGEVLVQVSVKKLVKAGLDPTSLTLWTREGTEGRWTPVPTVYNEKQQRLQAWLPHFSQFGLGAGLQQSGDMLPSVKAFTVDQLNGGAGVNIPLETPAGLGGMSPNLSLSYSSITMDDLFREAGDYEIEAQAGSPGIGWNLGGVSYIARADNKFNDDTPNTQKKFALVLNNTRVSISYQDGRWRTNPEIFARLEWSAATSGNNTYKARDFGGWTLWTTDGTKYEFGDSAPFPTNFAFSATSANATALEKTTGGDTFRLTKRWYLRKATDPLGNSMEYSYQNEKVAESGCLGANWTDAQQKWYTGAIDPTAIHWSGQGSGYTLRLLLTYAARTDTRITGDGPSDCLQPLYGINNRLTTVTVQTLINGSWQTQRSYALGQPDPHRFTRPGQPDKYRLYLNTIEQLGKNGGLLVRYSFSYSFNNPNRILLTSASTNLGGSVSYTYNTVLTSCSNTTCPHTKNRFAVTRRVTGDGNSNTRTVDYHYGTSVAPNETSAVADDGGFMGYQAISTTVYAQNDLTSVIQWERLDSFSSGAVADRSNPHPLRGKLQKREVRNAKGGTVYRIENYDWKAYWLENSTWQTNPTAVSSKPTSNDDPTPYFPTTWIRLEKETVTVGGAVNEKRYTYEGTYGNQIEVQEWADGNNLRTTKTDYFPNSGPWIVNKPARVRIFDGGGCKAETRIIYDGNGSTYNTLPTQGLVRRTQQALTDCSTAVTIVDTEMTWNISYFEYDIYGNQTSVNHLGNTASQNLVINTGYDLTYHLFPISQNLNGSSTYMETALYYGVNEISGHSSVAIWGAMQEHCGVNEICTRQSYDQFGRRVYRWEAMVKGSAWAADSAAQIQWDYTPYGGAQTATTILEWRNPRSEGNFVRQIYNGWGELIQEQRPYQNWTATNGQEVIVDYQYDALGRQTRSGIPWLTTKFAGGGTNTFRSTTWVNGYTATSYDAIDRTTWVTAPNGEQQQYGYSGRAMSITALGRNGDPNKIVKWQEMDGLGNLKYVRTYNPSGSSWTLDGQIILTHNVLGNLTQVIHVGVGTSTFTYDVGGRKTAMSDINLGNWGYAYDRQGKLTRQTDARNTTICLYYDAMARLEGKHFRNDTSCPANPSYDVNYAYDQDHTASSRSRGQLTNVGNSHYGKHLYYNSQGLLAREEVWISGIAQNANTYYGYDSYLRPTTTTYPDNEVVTTGYNGMGLPNSLSSSTGATVVDSTSYDAAGRVTQMRLPGSGILYQTYTYWPWLNGTSSNSNGRLKEIKVGTTNTNAASDSNRLYYLYGYDSFGNVGGMTEQYNNGTSATYSFCYDTQNRLIRAYAPYDSTKSCATYATGQVYGYELN